ncbi:hypothetical protein LQ327_15580 [Actinomycetospora endophytica]|uniref:Linalool dehydratase/isomerase domain-containing protein n=1 Tax=Actinomycetospora endophytica TaxID=2291215 RepID=A0ABS8P935_9PSEU|nr:hypothetical protein [Actinomycetospora endophytica]MCD2194792.1 hypothetical protein [Actinomycetospora endophytica]
MSTRPGPQAVPQPELSDRALGWLRFAWDKATTPDDWSDQGEPHPWWDRYGSPPMCVFPRFDLSEMAYTLPMLMESTPAWREAYTRIADELIWRFVSFWGGIDWNTLIGPDPNVDRYSPEWLCCAPEPLRGAYPLPGWTGNGVEPWGLQPDPVGADGNLFYRAWLNLTLGIRRYVAGEATEHDTFQVTGYRNRQFPWTHDRVARHLSNQLATRPQGPHCENTKIWPTCVTAAGLGLQLYDSLRGTDLHAPFPAWAEYARTHYMGLKPDGDLDWFAFYYDPVEDKVATLHEPYNALIFLHVLLPQEPAWATQLYELCTRAIGFSDRRHPVVHLAKDPRMIVTALVLARELGDTTTEARLRDEVEEHFQPRFFGEHDDRFGYWFGLDEPWPRGQLNAILAMADAAPPGAWSRVFDQPQTDVHAEPTLRDVDFPRVAIRQARNDMTARTLDVVTAVSRPEPQATTAVTVDRLPAPSLATVELDDRPHTAWRVTGSDAIEVDLPVDHCRLRVWF